MISGTHRGVSYEMIEPCYHPGGEVTVGAKFWHEGKKYGACTAYNAGDFSLEEAQTAVVAEVEQCINRVLDRQ